MQQWYIPETKKEFEKALKRLREIDEAPKGTPEYKEMMLLAVLINHYEEKLWKFPELDPVEYIKIRMEDFGYQPADLAKLYGDKGTVSKVLNYRQALSLTMIRKFGKLLRIPASILIKEYKLKKVAAK